MTAYKFIEDQVKDQFSFLQVEFNFPDFDVRQIRDEYYIRTQKGRVCVGVYVQMESDHLPSLSVWYTGDETKLYSHAETKFDYYIDELEENNIVISSIGNRGENNIRIFIKECAAILRRNSELLDGDSNKIIVPKKEFVDPSEVEPINGEGKGYIISFNRLSYAVLITAFLLSKYFLRALGNTIDAISFAFIYSAVGLLVTIVFLVLLYKWIPWYFKSGETRVVAIVRYFIGITGLVLGGAAYYNTASAKQQIASMNAVVIGKSHHRYSNTYLNLLIENKEERFQPTNDEWSTIQVNDTLELEVGKGNLGYRCIFKFSLEK